MPLSCRCDWDWDPDPGDYCFDSFYLENKDFEPLDSKGAKRCCSCNELIPIGSLCLKHNRHRYPRTDVEAKIYGRDSLDEAFNEEPYIKIPDAVQCEKCGEIWLNLQAVGFECLSPAENMINALHEYRETYQPPKLKPAIGKLRIR